MKFQIKTKMKDNNNVYFRFANLVGFIFEESMRINGF